jgi:hypothetical protein
LGVIGNSSSRLAFSKGSKCPHKWLCSTAPTDYSAWMDALDKCRPAERDLIMRCYTDTSTLQKPDGGGGGWAKHLIAGVVVCALLAAGLVSAIVLYQR